MSTARAGTMISDDIVEEMRDDLKVVRRLLLGNGQVGLCEQVRKNEVALTALAKGHEKLAEAMATLAKTQTEHANWHERPENMPPYQMFKSPGVRYLIIICALSLVVISLLVGSDTAIAFVKGIL